MIYLKFLLPAISSPVQILTDRQVDGSFFVNKTKSCLLCQNKTHPNAGGDRCVFCTQFFAVNGNCECNKDKLTGGVCLKSEPTGREQSSWAGAVTWPDRGSNGHQSLFRSISRHPKFRATNRPSFLRTCGRSKRAA